jgi:hypothetical protein
MPWPTKQSTNLGSFWDWIMSGSGVAQRDMEDFRSRRQGFPPTFEQRDGGLEAGALPTPTATATAPPGPASSPRGKRADTRAYNPTPALMADKVAADNPGVVATPALEAEVAKAPTTATYDSASPVPTPMEAEGTDWETEERRREPWLALAALGTGMMASKNPRFLGAMGEGGQDALKSIRQTADSARREALVKLERRQIAETERRNKALDVLERDKMSQQKDLETKALLIKDKLAQAELELNPAKKAKLIAEVDGIRDDIAVKNPAYATYLDRIGRASGAQGSAALMNAQTNQEAGKMSTPAGLIQWATEVDRLRNSADPAERRKGELLYQNSPAYKNQNTATKSRMDVAMEIAKSDPTFWELKPEQQEERINRMMSLGGAAGSGAIEVKRDPSGKLKVPGAK